MNGGPGRGIDPLLDAIGAPADANPWVHTWTHSKNLLVAIAAYRKAVRGRVPYVLVLQNVHFVI